MDLSDAIRNALNDVLRAQEAADTADPVGRSLTVEKIDIELSGAIVSMPDGTDQFVVLGSDDAHESSSGSPWKVAVQLSRPGAVDHDPGDQALLKGPGWGHGGPGLYVGGDDEPGIQAGPGWGNGGE